MDRESRWVCLLAALALVGTCHAQKTAVPKQPAASATRATTVLRIGGDLTITDEMAVAADELRLLIEQIGAGALPGLPQDVPGLKIAVRAVANRAETSGTAGDVVLRAMLIDYRAAKMNNARLEEDLGLAGMSVKRIRTVDGGRLYDLEHADIDADPAALELVRRENECDEAIRMMITGREAHVHVVECENAELDPPANLLPFETIGNDSEGRKACLSAMLYAADTIEAMFLSRAGSGSGLVGNALARHRLASSLGSCAGPEEKRLLGAVEQLYDLKSHVLLASELDVLHRYLSEPIQLSSLDEYTAWIKEGWKEVELSPKVKAAREHIRACRSQIDVAAADTSLAGDLDSCYR